MNEDLKLLAEKLERCGLNVKPHMSFAMEGRIVPAYRLLARTTIEIHGVGVIDLSGGHLAVMNEEYFEGGSKGPLKSLRFFKISSNDDLSEGLLNTDSEVSVIKPWYYACVFGGWIPARFLDPSSGFIVIDKNIYNRVTEAPDKRRTCNNLDILDPKHHYLIDPTPSIFEGNHMRIHSDAATILKDYEDRERDLKSELPNSIFITSGSSAVKKVMTCHKLMSKQWRSFDSGCDEYTAIVTDVTSKRSLRTPEAKFQEASSKIYESRLASPYECLFIGLAYEQLMFNKSLFSRIFHKRNKSGTDNRRVYGMPLCSKKRWNAFSDIFLLFYAALNLKQWYECGSQPAMLTSDVEVVRLWCRMNKNDLTMKSMTDFFSLGILTEDCRKLIPIEAIPYAFENNT